jgi:hypothetical protein
MANKRDELIEKYATHLREKFGVVPEMDLLKAVTIGLGPSIYKRDAANVSGTDEKELATVEQQFLIRKLGLPEGPELMKSIHEVVTAYGISERTKYRAVVYYMLTKRFGKESVYKK